MRQKNFCQEFLQKKKEKERKKERKKEKTLDKMSTKEQKTYWKKLEANQGEGRVHFYELNKFSCLNKRNVSKSSNQEVSLFL